ncbi:MAG: hypothetical protein C0592_04120 [Marinilabiliales bacterium]|nr:MAG: hypothetical protein C0592_04120 [Marinilabiliales bacterium]
MKKLFLLIIVLPLIMSSCEKNTGIVIFKKKITYKVSGTTSEILVTYTDERGDTKMTGLSTESIPWQKEFSVRPDTYLYLQAKNTTSTGDVKVEIFLRDNVLFSDYNDLPFGTATTSGFVN